MVCLITLTTYSVCTVALLNQCVVRIRYREINPGTHCQDLTYWPTQSNDPSLSNVLFKCTSLPHSQN